MYSKPSAYLSKIHFLEKKYTYKSDDFLPYSNDEYSFWTGYFSSRP